ncbi:MAG: hypothetical protein ACI4UY_02600, partial [Kiritimatiellia bacterium]
MFFNAWNHPTLPGARVRKFEHPQKLADARNGEMSPKTVAGMCGSLSEDGGEVNGKRRLEFTHFSPSRGSKAAQAGNSTPMVGKGRSTTVPLCFAILQPLSCRPSVALFSSGGSFLQTSSVVEY